MAGLGLGCSSSEGVRNDTLADDDDALAAALEVCEAENMPKNACGGEGAADAANDLARCKDETALCWARVVRPESLVVLRDCFKARTCVTENGYCRCNPIEDECFYEAGSAFRERPEVKSFTASCMAKRETCIAEGVANFVDDYCDVAMLNDATRTAMESCFDRPCSGDEVTACLTQAWIEQSKGACSE